MTNAPGSGAGVPIRLARVTAVLVLCLVGGAGAAFAQYLPFDAARRGYPISTERPSIRLLGMGGLGLVIPDEDNEVNLSDFGANLAGTAVDKDSWSVESWFGRALDLQTNESAGLSGPISWNREFDSEVGAMDATYRKGSKRAIGARVVWDGYSTSLMRDRDTRVRGPNIWALYNENFGRLSCAVGVVREKDNEDLVDPDVFAIRHKSTSWRESGALAWAFPGWDLGGQVDLDQVRIDGRSSDPSGYHLTEFRWIRPATRFRASLTRRGNAKLQAGVRLNVYNISGNEDARVSWSDRFPHNPSQANFTINVPTFEESQKGWDLTGRTLWGLGGNLDLGLLGQLTGEDWNVDEAPDNNFPGSLSQVHASTSTYRLGGGPGLSLLDNRLRLGAEGYYWHSKVTSTYPREEDKVKSRDAEFRVGGEWLLPNALVARAGFRHGANDTNLDLDGSLYERNGVTLGFGYVPRGGTIALDIAYQIQQQKPHEKNGLQNKSDVKNLAFSARFLF